MFFDLFRYRDCLAPWKHDQRVLLMLHDPLAMEHTFFGWSNAFSLTASIGSI